MLRTASRARVVTPTPMTMTATESKNPTVRPETCIGTCRQESWPSRISTVFCSRNMCFFDGERVARRDGPTGAGGVFYYFSDHLKTASVITDSAGVVKEESDYYPWGGELQFINNDSNHYKFTGKERDSETGLDYFGARYYSNGLGRFISADWSATPVPVPYADFSDPQSLNLFTYVRNIPTTGLDPDGHCTPLSPCTAPPPPGNLLEMFK